MADFLKELLEARPDTLFVLVGLALLAVAVLGNISGKIQPGKGGRIASGVLGPILIGLGLWMHSGHITESTESTTDTNSGQAQAENTTRGSNNDASVAGGLPPRSAHGTCLQGYVWREASPADHVCVVPAVREQTHLDNSQAALRRAGGGPYGPDSCKQGFVWRDAFGGDHVCVTPDVRTQAANDNEQASNRVAR